MADDRYFGGEPAIMTDIMTVPLIMMPAIISH
jgi:hypothetical protein